MTTICFRSGSIRHAAFMLRWLMDKEGISPQEARRRNEATIAAGALAAWRDLPGLRSSASRLPIFPDKTCSSTAVFRRRGCW